MAADKDPARVLSYILHVGLDTSNVFCTTPIFTFAYRPGAAETDDNLLVAVNRRLAARLVGVSESLSLLTWPVRCVTCRGLQYSIHYLICLTTRRMARSIGWPAKPLRSDTIHYAFSTNWMQRTRDSVLFDYPVQLQAKIAGGISRGPPVVPPDFSMLVGTPFLTVVNIWQPFSAQHSSQKWVEHFVDGLKTGPCKLVPHSVQLAVIRRLCSSRGRTIRRSRSSALRCSPRNCRPGKAHRKGARKRGDADGAARRRTARACVAEQAPRSGGQRSGRGPSSAPL
jgi:hypothetical protein